MQGAGILEQVLLNLLTHAKSSLPPKPPKPVLNTEKTGRDAASVSEPLADYASGFIIGPNCEYQLRIRTARHARRKG
jgi:hypothetical protein